MSAPVLALPPPLQVAAAAGKKRVLLVDTSTRKRELRAEVMRKLGMEVDCAADIGEAVSWWRADLYHLVLINVTTDVGQRDDFCQVIRSATPPQQLAFLVGKPEYLAASPNADEAVPLRDIGGQTLVGKVQAALSAEPGDPPQPWGILDASQRISAVRSASHARTRAMRDRPVPPRDVEARGPKQATGSRTLDDLLREEMQ